MINKSSTICVDTNLVLRTLLGGPYQDEVDEQWEIWLKNDVNFIAPPLFAFEATSVIWQHVFNKLISLEKGQRAFQKVFDQGIHFEYPPDLHKHAWEVAKQFNLHAAYDAHFVALAAHFGCEFWTLDRKLYQALSTKLPWVHIMPESN